MPTLKRDMTIKRGTSTLFKQDRNSFQVKSFLRLITRHLLLHKNSLRNKKILIVNLIILIVTFMTKLAIIKDQQSKIQLLVLNLNGIQLNLKLLAGNLARDIMSENRLFLLQNPLIKRLRLLLVKQTRIMGIECQE